MFKVVASAATNAENNYSLDPDELWVINAVTDEGVTVKRFRARSHGRASRILRRSSHITIYVSDDPQDLPKSVRQRKRR